MSASPCCDRALDERLRSFVEQFFDLRPWPAAYVNNILRLQFEVSAAGVKNVPNVHDERLRLLQRTAHHEHFASIGFLGEATAIGDCRDHRGIRSITKR